MFMAMTNCWWSFGDNPLARKGSFGGMPPKERTCIRMKREGAMISLVLKGSCRAEALLDRLPALFKYLGNRARMQIDASQAMDMDNLALSALVVCLRNHAGRLESVCLRGLPWWALGRLQFFGPGHVLGPGWTGSYEADCIHLTRPEAEPATISQ